MCRLRKKKWTVILLVATLIILSAKLLSHHQTANLIAETLDTEKVTLSSTVPQIPFVRNRQSEIYRGFGNFNVQIIGNSNTVGWDYGSGGNAHTKYIDEDDDPTTFNSTSMDYHSTGKIHKAYAYFTQTGDNSASTNNREGLFLLGPKGDKFLIDDGYKEVYYDVTSFVESQGSGSYWGKNIASARAVASNYDSNSNWYLIVIEQDPSFNFREVNLQSIQRVVQNPNLTYQLTSGLMNVPQDPTGQYIITSSGGNKGYDGDYLYIISSDAKNVTLGTKLIQEEGRVSTDFFSGRITKNGKQEFDRNPSRVPANTDIAVSDMSTEDYLIPGMRKASFRVYGTGADRFTLETIGLSLDAESPELEIGNTQRISADGGGDKQVITTITNGDPNVILSDSYLTIKLPKEATYVENSMDLSAFGDEVSFEYNSDDNEIYIRGIRDVEPEGSSFSYTINLKNNDYTANIVNEITGDLYYKDTATNTNYPVTIQGNDTLIDVRFKFDPTFSLERTKETLRILLPAWEENIDGIYTDLEVRLPLNTEITNMETMELPTGWTMIPMPATLDSSSVRYSFNMNNSFETIRAFLEEIRFEITSSVDEPGEIQLHYRNDLNDDESDSSAAVPQKVYVQGRDSQGSKLTEGDQVLETALTIGKKERFISKNIKNYEYIDLQQPDGTIITPEDFTIGSLKQDAEAVYGLTAANLHVRQVILDSNNQLLKPMDGVGSIDNTAVLGGIKVSQTPITYPTRNVNEANFKLITYNVRPSAPFYHLSMIIPEYYTYAGYVITPSAQIHNAATRLTGVPSWNVTEQPTIWVTIYLSPNIVGGSNPGFYGWAYGNDQPYQTIP